MSTGSMADNVAAAATSLVNDISSFFTDAPPGQVSIACLFNNFMEGFKETFPRAFAIGLVVGLVATIALAIVATTVAAPLIPIIVAVAAAAGIGMMLGSIIDLGRKWGDLSPQERARAAGRLTGDTVGGLAGGAAGGAAGGIAVSAASEAAASMSGGGLVPQPVGGTAGASGGAIASSTPAVGVAGATVGSGVAMASGGGSGGGGPPKKPRKPSQPNRKKWEEKGGKVVEHSDGSTTYTNKDGVSVRYSKERYPDFSPHAKKLPNGKKSVEIEMVPDHYEDYIAANEKAGYGSTPKAPEGYTWHHAEDGKTMQLIPTEIHSEFSHSGGHSLAK